MRKVFGIGLNKTGTKTLGECFKVFGFKHYSYDFNLLNEYSNNNYQKIFEVCNEYQSFEDWPWPLLYKEFEKEYSDAKFILTIRKNPDTWFESLCRHAIKTGPTETREIVFGFPMPHDHKKHHIDFYNKHNSEVIEYFKGREDKLLIINWEKDSGWQELAEFLGFPVPQIPLPHLNPSK